MNGYFESPWPAEDGGPQRLQSVIGLSGLHIQPGEKLQVTRRWLHLAHMVVLRAPGEVYLMTSSGLQHRYLGMATTNARIHKLDPISLKTICKSPKLPGGPFWPSGMAVHRNGDLYVTYGRWCHRLNKDCELLQSFCLPCDIPYNSLIILDNGLLVMKPFSDQQNARISVLDPETLQPVCEDVFAPEPSIARLSGKGNSLYLIGVRSAYRYYWDAQNECLRQDENWICDYVGNSPQSYGWDAVISERDVWFMDNGRHTYFNSMLGQGVQRTPLNIIRINQQDPENKTILPVCGLSGGSVTNPPFYNEKRRILLAFDSANARLKAFRHNPGNDALLPIWEKKNFGMSSHVVHFSDSGEIVLNDFNRWRGEHCVLLDLESGRELDRVAINSWFQAVIFPAPGWQRDFYYLTFDKIARVFL